MLSAFPINSLEEYVTCGIGFLALCGMLYYLVKGRD